MQRPPAPQVPVETTVPRSKYSDDSRIAEVESDISHFSQQLRQLESEMETTRSSLDQDVERCRAAAEAKKTRADNLEDDLRRAKTDWGDADRDFRKAKSKRDKEVDDAQKRIDDQKKRIKNAEVAREKRIREIEKEKQA
jgi:chromosome segregation ATPase